MKLVRQIPTCSLEDVPVYGSLRVSSSSDWLNLPHAFDFAVEESKRTGLPMHLQTIGEALAARVSFQEDIDKHSDVYDTVEKREAGLGHSHNYQRTSTVSLKLRNTGFNVDVPYVTAFVDLPTGEKSRALVQAGYEASSKGELLVLPVKDSFICDLIARAKEAGRIAPAQTTKTLQLKLEKEKGKSEYGQHQTPTAIFGSAELAELNVTYLKAKGYDFGKVWDLTQKELEKMLKEDETLVRACGLGGGNYFGSFDDVYADSQLDDVGWARPVVHVGAQKSSSGNKGKVKTNT